MGAGRSGRFRIASAFLIIETIQRLSRVKDAAREAIANCKECQEKKVIQAIGAVLKSMKDIWGLIFSRLCL